MRGATRLDGARRAAPAAARYLIRLEPYTTLALELQVTRA